MADNNIRLKAKDQRPTWGQTRTGKPTVHRPQSTVETGTERPKVAHLKRILQLWGISAKLDLMWFLRDTKYCIANIVADLIASLSAIAGVFLIAERFGDIGGMTKDQILFMLGYACLVDGVISMFFGMNNVGWISRIIGRGQLDHRLIQPVPLWMQFLTEGFIPVSGNSKLLCGIGITSIALQRLTVSLGAKGLLLISISVVGSVTVILSFSYLTGSLAFYAPVAGEEISSTSIGLFSALKTFPIGGLTTGAKFVLCTVVPVGLTAWFPANLVLGQPPQGLPNYLMLVVTMTMALAAMTVFRKGLKHYAKYGSIRYHDRGHRR